MMTVEFNPFYIKLFISANENKKKSKDSDWLTIIIIVNNNNNNNNNGNKYDLFRNTIKMQLYSLKLQAKKLCYGNKLR